MTVSSPRPPRARGSGDTPDGEPPADRGPQRPLAVTGAIAACTAAGAGLAALTLLAGIGWIAAPHASVGSGLSGVLRTAIQLWLVGHHVSFELRGTGRVGLLPLGLVLLPGALLWRSGRWVVRTGQVEGCATSATRPWPWHCPTACSPARSRWPAGPRCRRRRRPRRLEPGSCSRWWQADWAARERWPPGAG